MVDDNLDTSKPHWKFWRDDQGKVRWELENISVSKFIGKVIGYVVAGALTLGGADTVAKLIQFVTGV